jgi:hypothetical protein
MDPWMHIAPNTAMVKGHGFGTQSCSSHRNAVNPQGFFSQEQNSTRKLSHKPSSRPSITPSNSTPEAPLPSSPEPPLRCNQYPSWNASSPAHLRPSLSHLTSSEPAWKRDFEGRSGTHTERTQAHRNVAACAAYHTTAGTANSHRHGSSPGHFHIGLECSIDTENRAAIRPRFACPPGSPGHVKS